MKVKLYSTVLLSTFVGLLVLNLVILHYSWMNEEHSYKLLSILLLFAVNFGCFYGIAHISIVDDKGIRKSIEDILGSLFATTLVIVICTAFFIAGGMYYLRSYDHQFYLPLVSALISYGGLLLAAEIKDRNTKA